VMMSHTSVVFSRRIPEDRPGVFPDRAGNFAFLGQFTDLPPCGPAPEGQAGGR
jgi:oleate hydratase